MPSTDLARSYNRGRVLDHNGEPWQKEDGYDQRFALPHVITFNTINQTAWKVYLSRYHDEALRDSPDNARFMLNDMKLMGLVQERRLAVSSLEGGVEVESDKDPAQKAVKDGLNRIVNATKQKSQMLEYLTWTVWYGRYAAQVNYEWREMDLPDPMQGGASATRKVPVITQHQPVNGDKIGFRWDGTPFIKVHSSRGYDVPNASLIYTDSARAIELRGSWRSKFILHKHQPFDADFSDAMAAGGIHGVGIRSYAYWSWWLRNEWLSNMTDWCERTGLGVRVWYYQGGNAQSESQVKKAATSQSDRTNILIPRYNTGNGRPLEGLEYVDTSGTGAELLLRAIEHIEQAWERFIVGQSMSGGADKDSGLGGTGRAEFAADTKGRITQSDANALADTLTSDWIRPLATWVYGPKYADLVRWAFVFHRPNPERILQAVGEAAALGVEFKEDDVRSLTGLAAPQEGDKTVGGKSAMPIPGIPTGPGFQVGHHNDGNPQSGGQNGQPDDVKQPERQDFARDGEAVRYVGNWDESKHPRGQPGNAGEFGPGGGGRKATKTPAKSQSPTAPSGSGVAAQAREAVKKLKKSKQRAFEGKPVEATKISKQLAGAIGEEIVIQHLKANGFKDARHLNTEKNNEALDLIQDHESIEVKTGQASNGAGAQQWRLTIGEPSKEEKAKLAAMNDAEKAAANELKQRMIHERKKRKLAALEKELGRPVKARTITVILNPDTRTADLYSFDGWHDRIGWNSPEAQAGYMGSVTYG